jgi:hypothetical protein
MNDTYFKKQFTFNPSPITVEIEFVKYKEKEIPKTIYKYRDWTNKFHKKLITNREVFFPPAVGLNDPFDSQRNFDWEELLDPEKHKQYNEIASKRVAQIHNLSEQERIKFMNEGLEQKMNHERIKEMELSVEEKDGWMNKLAGTFTTSLINNSILLWSHYADSHRGFSVGLDTKLILDSIKHGGDCQFADYNPKLELISMLDDIITELGRKTFAKYEVWGYEFEFRILAGQLKSHKIFPPPEAFKEIIFGINTSGSDKAEIKHRARKQIPSVKFFQAQKVRNEYRIEILPL